MGIDRKRAYSFRHSADTKLVMLGVEDYKLNTFTNHAPDSKATRDYYVFADSLQHNDIATKLSESHGHDLQLQELNKCGTMNL
jgi:hypothetical protein